MFDVSAVNQMPADSPGLFRRWRNFAMCIAGLLLLWLVILPALSDWPPLQATIRFQEERNIDADAMFYTDLEMMDELIEKNERFRRTNPEALWIPR